MFKDIANIILSNDSNKASLILLVFIKNHMLGNNVHFRDCIAFDSNEDTVFTYENIAATGINCSNGNGWYSKNT